MAKNNETVLEAAREQIDKEIEGLKGVTQSLDDSFIEVVETLLKCKGKVFITGSGTSGAIARRMGHLLSVCGTPSMFISAMDALHGTMGAMSENDVLITISRGGETDELNGLSRRVRPWGIPVIAITAAPESTLAALADTVCVIDVGREADPGGVIAMGSTLGVAIWGDALATVLMRLREYGWDQMLYTHPAGAVGQMTKEPSELASLKAQKSAGAGT